jgi:uncharacterized protein DUF1707
LPPTRTIIVVATRQTPGTRAKDSDRNDTCRILDSALADGQLSMEEHRTRVALATGAETLGMKPADVKSTYLSFDPSRDPTTPGALSIDVYVSSDYGSGYIELAGDGTVKQINYPS